MLRCAIPLLTLGLTAPNLAAAADRCEESLAAIESASRAAQNTLLVARARDEKPVMTGDIAALDQAMADARAACASPTTSAAPNDGDTPATAPRDEAATPENAPEGSKRLNRAQRGY